MPNQYDDKELEKALLGFKGGYGGHSLSSIMQLITQKQLEARIDELKRIEPKGDDRPLIWTMGNDPNLAMTIDERIAELKAGEQNYTQADIEGHGSDLWPEK